MKNTSVYRIALTDISQHHNLTCGKQENRDVVGWTELWTKEVRRLNRALGIHNINYEKGKKNKKILTNK